MKYEAPICENVMLETKDIIHTSGYPNNDGGVGDTSNVPVPLSDLDLKIGF